MAGLLGLPHRPIRIERPPSRSWCWMSIASIICRRWQPPMRGTRLRSSKLLRGSPGSPWISLEIAWKPPWRLNRERCLRSSPDCIAEKAKRQRQDQIVRSFVDWLVPEVEKQVVDLDAPAGVAIGIETFDKAKQPPPSGFRNPDIDGTRSFRFNLEAAPPASASLPRRVDIFVDGDAENGAVLLRGVQTPDEQLRLARSDLEPTISSLAQRRIENFVSRVLGNGLDELLQKARQQIGR